MAGFVRGREPRLAHGRWRGPCSLTAPPLLLVLALVLALAMPTLSPGGRTGTSGASATVHVLAPPACGHLQLRRGALLGPLAALVASPVASWAQAVRIVRPAAGAPLFSFELPPGFEAQEAVNGDQRVAVYSRKDGAVIAAGPPETPDFVKNQRSQIGPGAGKVVNKYRLGDEQDDLEVTELMQVAPGTSNLVDGRRSANHLWLRALHGSSGDAVIILQLPQEKLSTERTLMEGVLNSFRLGG
mmetsp:Transcript_41084/g.114190  ORF Transcript_41084/g.114190 Transcript_41084/m.114190 type:complete len:243 (-) Transcript_41084:126-854(-)